LGASKVTSNAKLKLMEYIDCHQFKLHCMTKEKRTPVAFKLIDWDAIRDATTTAPDLFNLWMTKQVSGHCGIGKMMKLWKFWEESKCHSWLWCTCGRYVPHTLSPCRSTESLGQGSYAFCKWMKSVDTDPDIYACLQARDSNTLFHAYLASFPEHHAGCIRSRSNWLGLLY
jgi:hypothetical protein